MNDDRPTTDEELAAAQPASWAFKARTKAKLTQRQFSDTYKIPLGTLKQWESFRARPDAAAENYLKVIYHNPEAIADAIAKASAA